MDDREVLLHDQPRHVALGQLKAFPMRPHGASKLDPREKQDRVDIQSPVLQTSDVPPRLGRGRGGERVRGGTLALCRANRRASRARRTCVCMEVRVASRE